MGRNRRSRKKGDDETSSAHIAIYVRVSTQDQAQGSDTSLDNQTHRCKQYLFSQGYTGTAVENAMIYREEGYSGKSLDRPELQRLLRDIRRGKVTLVIFTELSRISRSIRDFLNLTELFDSYGTSFVSLKERFDTSGAQGRLVMTILMALYQFEREMVSARTQAALRDRSERGLWCGGKTPFGYHLHPEKSGHLIIEKNEAQIVRTIFKIYLEVGSMSQTIRLLEKRGYRRPPKTYSTGRVVEGDILKWNTVRGILQNPSYAGWREVNRCHRDLDDEEMAQLPREERYALTEGQWEPIIDQENFELAQELRIKNGLRNGSVVKGNYYAFVLSSVLFCAHCGEALRGRSAKEGRYFYYRHPRSNDCDPPRRSVRADHIEPLIINHISKMAQDDAFLEKIIASANKRINDGVPELQREVSAAEARVRSLRGQRESLVANLMSAPEDTVPAVFWTRVADLEAEIKATQLEADRQQQVLDDMRAARLTPEDYRTVLKRFDELYERLNNDRKLELIQLLVDRIELDGDEVHIAFLGDLPPVGALDALTGPFSGHARSVIRTYRHIEKHDGLPGDDRSLQTGAINTLQLPKFRTHTLPGRKRQFESAREVLAFSEFCHDAIAQGMKPEDLVCEENIEEGRLEQILNVCNLPGHMLEGVRNGEGEFSTWSPHMLLQLATKAASEERSPAAKALLKARKFQQRLDTEEGLSRGQIARDEGVSRTWVTNLLKLLSLPQQTQEALINGDPQYLHWSVKRAIDETRT